MRSLLAMLATVLLLNVAAIDNAEARRLGGGKSFGKSFTTKPFQRKQTPPAGNAAQQAGKSSKRGMLGGIFGGLLAGGLLAALFAGGAFEGIQFMDILIFALIAFIIFKIFRSMTRAKAAAQGHGNGAAYAGHGGFGQPSAPQQQPSPGFETGGFSGSSSGSDVPFNLPPGFDLDAFLNGARDHFRELQDAWNRGDMEKLREYFSPEMFAELSAERASLETDPQTEVMFVDVELGRADHNQSLAQISLRFSGRTRDAGEGVEEDITDVWHLERDLTQPNAPWMIVGIEN